MLLKLHQIEAILKYRMFENVEYFRRKTNFFFSSKKKLMRLVRVMESGDLL